MSYTQMTGMSSTRFPLKGLGGCGCGPAPALSGCGCGTSGFGQVPPPGVTLSTVVAVAALGTVLYFGFARPASYGGGSYYDHRLGKMVRRNRRRNRRR